MLKKETHTYKKNVWILKGKIKQLFRLCSMFGNYLAYTFLSVICIITNFL